MALLRKTLALWLAFSTSTAYALPASSSASDTQVPGCGKTLLLQDIEVLKSVANSRDYWYHLPAGYDKTKQYPVVLAFHGSSKIGSSLDGLAFAADSRLSSSEFSPDKIMVYPNGKSVGLLP